MKQSAPSAERNKSFIFAVLDPLLKKGAKVFEVAGGTGQHAAYVSQRRPDIVWQTSDRDQASLASMEAYRSELAPSLPPPRFFDLLNERPEDPQGPFDLIVNINMIHISPWSACLKLLDYAARNLSEGGFLYFYGPFLVEGVATAPSNLEFDRSLKERDPEWGIRSLERVSAEARERGFSFYAKTEMPANNLSVVFSYSSV